jgi:hypothetical protein
MDATLILRVADVDPGLAIPDGLRGRHVLVELEPGARGLQGSDFIAWLSGLIRHAALVTLVGADPRLRTLLRLVGLDRRFRYG